MSETVYVGRHRRLDAELDALESIFRDRHARAEEPPPGRHASADPVLEPTG